MMTEVVLVLLVLLASVVVQVGVPVFVGFYTGSVLGGFAAFVFCVALWRLVVAHPFDDEAP